MGDYGGGESMIDAEFGVALSAGVVGGILYLFIRFLQGFN